MSKELDETIADSASKAGWTTVGTHLSRFMRHGYCTREHWLVRWDEANKRQERPSETEPAPGVMHPNPAGQRAYATAIVRALAALGLPGVP